MNIFLVGTLLLILFLLARYAWAEKSSELFSSFYLFLCFYISTNNALVEHPFIDIQGLLTAVGFCFIALLVEARVPLFKQITIKQHSIQTLLKAIALYSPMAFVSLLILFNRTDTLLLLVFASSAITSILVWLLEYCFKYFSARRLL